MIFQLRNEKWSDSGYNLKVEVIGFTWGEEVRCEERRGDKASSKIFGLSNRKDEVAST